MNAMLNSDRLKQKQQILRLIDDSADWIAMEFAVRANDNMSLSSAEAVDWLRRELARFACAVGLVK